MRASQRAHVTLWIRACPRAGVPGLHEQPTSHAIEQTVWVGVAVDRRAAKGLAKQLIERACSRMHAEGGVVS